MATDRQPCKVVLRRLIPGLRPLRSTAAALLVYPSPARPLKETKACLMANHIPGFFDTTLSVTNKRCADELQKSEIELLAKICLTSCLGLQEAQEV
jgi:hypothetical protein